MNLGEYIEWLESKPKEFVMPVGFGEAHSYRGYYTDLAFEAHYDVSIAQMLSEAKVALGETYQGYKGGDFTMGEWTDVWIAEYGRTGDGMSKLLLDAIYACGLSHTVTLHLKESTNIRH